LDYQVRSKKEAWRKKMNTKQAEMLRDLKELLHNLAEKDRGFAESLVSQGSSKWLSSKQMYWAEELLRRALGIAPPPAEKVDVGGKFSTIVRLFEKAKTSGLKWPKLYMKTEDGYPVCLTMGGPKSKYAEEILVTNGGPFGSNIWYGHITKEGQWTLPMQKPDGEESVVKLLRMLANDPSETAFKQGVFTGKCMFCNTPLTAENSTAVGFGPVCAEKWGLKTKWKQGLSLLK
jgi:hypothetical protein